MFSGGGDPGAAAPIKVVRFSRTASDGNPIRDWDRSFPAVDTAKVWGLARQTNHPTPQARPTRPLRTRPSPQTAQAKNLG